ncbi:hypothetical protein PENTCL1PPCAC_5878, partial [Pristionchus entomophagus]
VQMLPSVSECTARTATDVKIYAEKAAFEGQALRSLMNGLQTRSKYKLSDVTKHFAQRCYERRLFFYTGEALRVCIEDPSGKDKAEEILLTKRDDLQSGWEPLLDHCANILREMSLETSKLRLSRLSDIWNKRSVDAQAYLLSLVDDIVRYRINDKHEHANRISFVLERIIDSSSSIFIAANGSSAYSEVLSNLITNKRSQNVIMNESTSAVQCAIAYINEFVKGNGKTLHVVGSVECIDLILDEFPHPTDQPSKISLTYDNTHVHVSSLEYLSAATNIELGAVLLIGLEREALVNTSDQKDLVAEDLQCDINDLIVDIHIWGNILITQMEEIKQRHVKHEALTDFINSWPKHMRDELTNSDKFRKNSLRDQIWNVISSASKDHRIREFVEQTILNRAKKIWEKKYTSDNVRIPQQCVEGFNSSRGLTIDSDYSIFVEEKISSGLSLRVRIISSHIANAFVKSFLELRHGCELTPQSTSSSRNYSSILEDCTHYFQILRADRFTIEQLDKVETNLKNTSHVKKLNPTIPGSQSLILPSPSVKQEITIKTCMNTFKVANLDVDTGTDNQIPQPLVKKKRSLYILAKKIKKQAMMVHLLREPLGTGENCPLEIRCDGFVEHALSALEYIEQQIQIIDEQLKLLGNIWPSPERCTVFEIANAHNVRREFLWQLALDVVGQTPSIQQLVDSIKKKTELELDDDPCKTWEKLEKDELITDSWSGYVLPPDCISDATPILQHMILHDFSSEYKSERLKMSNRYHNDCAFYTLKEGVNPDILKNLGTVFDEKIARCDDTKWTGNYAVPDSSLERCIIGTKRGKNKHPLYLYPTDVCLRIAIDLIDSGSVPCSNGNDFHKRQDTYENLRIPFIYDPTFTIDKFKSRVCHSLLTELQGAMLDYGSHEWFNWFKKRLETYEFGDSDIVYFRQTIAEREFCVRDEILIKRIRQALRDTKRKKVVTPSDEIQMDAFVNVIVEKINRGERLVEIKPPFSDEKTAEKLARFIRSRRIPPKEY